MRIRITCIVFALLTIGCFPSSSFAEWAWVPLKDLVQDSDLIVVGTLEAVSEHSKDGWDYGQGTIVVHEVIWGDATPGDLLTLKWQNLSNILCPRVEPHANENKPGIWLLTFENEREVGANYPGRFVDLDEKKKVERFLLRKNICLRASNHIIFPDEPANVSIIFRNPTQTQLQFPGLQYEDGYLYINSDVHLALHSGWGESLKKISPLPNRVVESDNITPIVVEPGQEYKVTIDLKELFEIKPEENYSFQLKVKGYDPGNVVILYFQISRPSNNTDISGDQGIAGTENDTNFGLPWGSVVGAIGLSMFLVLYQYQARKR